MKARSSTGLAGTIVGTIFKARRLLLDGRKGNRCLSIALAFTLLLTVIQLLLPVAPPVQAQACPSRIVVTTTGPVTEYDCPKTAVPASTAVPQSSGGPVDIESTTGPADRPETRNEDYPSKGLDPQAMSHTEAVKWYGDLNNWLQEIPEPDRPKDELAQLEALRLRILFFEETESTPAPREPEEEEAPPTATVDIRVPTSPPPTPVDCQEAERNLDKAKEGVDAAEKNLAEANASVQSAQDTVTEAKNKVQETEDLLKQQREDLKNETDPLEKGTLRGLIQFNEGVLTSQRLVLETAQVKLGQARQAVLDAENALRLAKNFKEYIQREFDRMCGQA